MSTKREGVEDAIILSANYEHTYEWGDVKRVGIKVAMSRQELERNQESEPQQPDAKDTVNGLHRVMS